VDALADSRIAVKRLLRQHLSHDDEALDVHPLAELILSEGIRMGAGSSIKTDGEESDPWALVAVLDLAKNKVCRACLPPAGPFLACELVPVVFILPLPPVRMYGFATWRL